MGVVSGGVLVLWLDFIAQPMDTICYAALLDAIHNGSERLHSY